MMATATLRVRVDVDLVERATAELRTALAAQNMAFAQRLEMRWFPPEKQRIARRAALALCALGAGPLAFLIATVPSRCAAAALGWVFVASFGILAIAFHRHTPDLRLALAVGRAFGRKLHRVVERPDRVGREPRQVQLVVLAPCAHL